MYEHGFEVIATGLSRGRLMAYVPPCDSLRETIKALQQDDPAWHKPRIRVMSKDRIRLYKRYRLDLPAMTFERNPFA